MSLLEKPKKDLTKAELLSLVRPLGVKGHPYPMWEDTTALNEKGEKIQVRRLGVIEGTGESNQKPLLVFSDRNYADVLSIAMRDMVTPSTLPMFAEAINMRHPDNGRRIAYYKGAAGTGKTYMSEMIGSMRSSKGAIKVDCANLDMGELLYETVLDLNADRSFYNALDKRLAAGKLNPFSVKRLQESLGEAWVEENGRAAIDWHKIGQNLRQEAQNGKAPEEQNYIPSEQAVKIAQDALREVAELEGLGAAGGNMLGMITREGPLIQAYREGREIILDEFNRCKKNSTGKLHGVLQFAINDIHECRVNNTLKEKSDEAGHGFVFSRDDMKPGFFITLTGNTESDGSDIDELPQSLNSRIIPQRVPAATVEDWQHRICQILTGLPVSTLYHAAQHQWDQDPDAFRQRLKEWRMLREDREVPEIQMHLLDNWEGVVKASEKLAKFYYGWSEVVDPDSPMHRRAASLGQLLSEIDESYTAEVSIDFRKVIAHVNEALYDKPALISPDQSEGFDLSASLEDMPVLPETILDRDDVAMDFGTRLSEVIVRHIVKTTRDHGKEQIYQQVMRIAQDNGVVPAHFNEGKASENSTVAELLNNNPYESKSPDVQAALVRDILCDHLRGRYQDLSPNNDDIVPVATVRRALDDIEAAENAQDCAQAAEALVFNDDENILHREPFTRAINFDMTPEPGSKIRKKIPSPETLVGQQELLVSLTAPALRDHNLQAIWNRALSGSGAAFEGQGQIRDESLAMAENNASRDIAITTIKLRDDMGAQKGAATDLSLHVVWNKAKGQVLVVGEGAVDSNLKKAFNYNNIQYVDRLEQGAGRKITSALNSVLGAEGKELEPMMKEAFLMRNMLSSLEEEDSSLADLMARRDMECFLPHYLVKKKGSSPAMK